MNTETAKQHPFKLLIDHKQYDWPESNITGLQLKQLAGVDPAVYAVYMQVPGAHEDPEIANDKTVDLTTPGVEKFFTGKKHTTEG